MKEYEILISEEKTVYVEAESEEEAISRAEIIECGFSPDKIKCKVVSVIEDE